MAKKKKFQAIKADVGEYQGIVHDGKEHRFRKDDTFIIEDEGLARELDSMYGKKGTQKLAITPYDDQETREPGHTYTFGPSRKFSTAWEEFEKRRKDKKNTKQKRVRRRKGAEVRNGISSHKPSTEHT